MLTPDRMLTVEPFTATRGTCDDELCHRDPRWTVIERVADTETDTGHTAPVGHYCDLHVGPNLAAVMQSIQPSEALPGLADRTASVNILRDENGGDPHVRLRVFVGTTPGSRAFAGVLTVRREEEPVTRDALEGEHAVKWGVRRRDGMIVTMDDRAGAEFMTSGDAARDYPDVVHRATIIGPWRTEGL